MVYLSNYIPTSKSIKLKGRILAPEGSVKPQASGKRSHIYRKDRVSNPLCSNLEPRASEEDAQSTLRRLT